MRHIIIAVLAVVLFAGCASTFKGAVQTAKDGAELWWEDGGKEQVIELATKVGTEAAESIATMSEEKLAKLVEEKTGNPPSFYENPDGSTNWTGLLGSGPLAIAAYFGWRRVRKAKESFAAVKEKAKV